jgi:hypothetical protein
MFKIRPIVSDNVKLGTREISLSYEITLFWFFKFNSTPVYFLGGGPSLESVEV